MKHVEASVGVKLFGRRGGRYTPTSQANAFFNQINSAYDKVEDLQFVISRIKRGANTELQLGSVPSIANAMVSGAIADLRRTLSHLLIEVDILKIEDAVARYRRADRVPNPLSTGRTGRYRATRRDLSAHYTA
jgi:DNA-binding transcriptional LysR family regulator